MKKQRIIIDTDLGNDDIIAIAMLLLSSSLKIEAISLVNGVSSISYSKRNIFSILKYLAKNIPVYVNRKITDYYTTIRFPARDVKRAESVSLVKKINLKQVKGRTFDLDDLLDKPGKSVILAIGPLTNLAYLAQTQPKKFKNRISQIVIMGGGVKKGNVPPLRLAEYNIALDPIAAKIVFDFGIPITMIGIDATAQVSCTKSFKNQIKTSTPNSNASKILKEIIINNNGDFDQFYDPLAAAYLIDPKVIRKQTSGSIQVICKGEQIGRTVLSNKKQKLVSIVTKINSYTGPNNLHTMLR